MKRNNHASVVRLTSLAILAALVVVLQTVASGIRIGPVPISLTLVPIVVGAILFGPGAGAGLGFVFGLVCLIAGVTGADQFTYLLWTASPFWLIVVCVGKAVLCGLCAGLAAKALRKEADAQLHCGGAGRAGREHGRVCRRDADGLPADPGAVRGRDGCCDVSVRGVHRRELFGGIRRQRGAERRDRADRAGRQKTAGKVTKKFLCRMAQEFFQCFRLAISSSRP